MAEQAKVHPAQHELPLGQKPAGMAALGRARKLKRSQGRKELAALMHFYASRAP